MHVSQNKAGGWKKETALCEAELKEKVETLCASTMAQIHEAPDQMSDEEVARREAALQRARSALRSAQQALGETQRALQSAEDATRRASVARDASSRELKKAYHALAMKWHPDRKTGEDDEKHEAMFKKISRAYEILGDKARTALSYCCLSPYLQARTALVTTACP